MIVTLDLVIFAGAVFFLMMIFIWRLIINVDEKELVARKKWYVWLFQIFFPPFKASKYDSKLKHRLGVAQWLLIIISVSTYLYMLYAY